MLNLWKCSNDYNLVKWVNLWKLILLQMRNYFKFYSSYAFRRNLIYVFRNFWKVDSKFSIINILLTWQISTFCLPKSRLHISYESNITFKIFQFNLRCSLIFVKSKSLINKLIKEIIDLIFMFDFWKKFSTNWHLAIFQSGKLKVSSIISFNQIWHHMKRELLRCHPCFEVSLKSFPHSNDSDSLFFPANSCLKVLIFFTFQSKINFWNNLWKIFHSNLNLCIEVFWVFKILYCAFDHIIIRPLSKCNQRSFWLFDMIKYLARIMKDWVNFIFHWELILEWPHRSLFLFSKPGQVLYWSFYFQIIRVLILHIGHMNIMRV